MMEVQQLAATSEVEQLMPELLQQMFKLTPTVVGNRRFWHRALAFRFTYPVVRERQPLKPQFRCDYAVLAAFRKGVLACNLRLAPKPWFAGVSWWRTVRRTGEAGSR
jgi:hypothetical protein